MKEILIFAGYLGLLLFVLWVTVAVIERRLAILKSKKEAISEENGEDEIPVPVILAGIRAYESCCAPEKKRVKRVLYQPKEETVSLWKIRGRVR